MNIENIKLFRSIEVFAKIICARAGVSISFSGTTASTDGSSIRLPVFPKVLDDLAVAKILFQGFVLHESFHVLWSDFDIFRKYCKQFRNRKPAFNILEDIRIELKGGFWVVGFKKSLSLMCNHLVAKGDFFQLPTQDLSPVALCNLYLLYSLRFNVLGQAAFNELSAQSKTLFEQKIGFESVSEIDQVVLKITEAQSTQDVALLVDKLYVLLDKLAEKNSQQDQPKNQDPSQDPESGDDQSPDESNDESTGTNDQPQDPGSSDDSSDGASDGSDDEDDDQKQSGSNDDPQTGDSSEEPSGVQWGVNEDGSLDPSVEEDWDIGNVISGAINGDEESQKEAVSKMTRGDVHFPTVFGPSPSARQSNERDLGAIASARSTTNSLAFQLRSLLEAKKSVQHSRRTSGLRVGHSSLAKVAVGDFRVFQKTTRIDGINTAVYVLMDVSDSMNEHAVANDRRTPVKLKVARESVLALALALDSISDVKVGVMAYPQGHLNPQTENFEQYMNDLVEIGESVQLRSKAIMNVSANGSTPTAEAILYARSKMDIEVDRRVILVITDGDSDNESRLIDVLNQVSKDTEVIGIGIGTDSVKRTFKNFAVINSAADLTGIAFRKMKQVLAA